MATTSPVSWTVAEVEADKGWIYRLSAAESAELLLTRLTKTASNREFLATLSKADV